MSATPALASPPATSAAAAALPDLSVPYDLATRGQWQALLAHLAHPSHAHHPHHRLLLSALSALSLAKLRRFPEGAALLASLHPDPGCPPPPFLLRLLRSPPLFFPDRPSLSTASTRSSHRSGRPNAQHPEWRRRDALVASILASDHLAHREFDVALALVAELVAPVREYERCIEADPSDAIALNNKALCLMYSRDLGDAIKVLEGALETMPTAALNETVVVNLCSMYELAFVNHGEVKRTLADWITRVAPDDFDKSCTRM
ncbi:hypothetical protein ZWY2020_021174 [Hordeum vulgare]|nr:hypothetical protein ZWY2020_021174 [Hordeum vulgare]